MGRDASPTPDPRRSLGLWSGIALAALNGIAFLASAQAFMIYTSLVPGTPWYDACGMQLLGLPLMVAPALAASGAGLLLLGLRRRVSAFNRALPWVGGVPVVLGGMGSISEGGMTAGAVLAAALGLLIVGSSVAQLCRAIVEANRTDA